MHDKITSLQKRRFQFLLMKAMDKEMSADEQHEFKSFVNRFDACRRCWQHFRKLREVIRSMEFKAPSSREWNNYWFDVRNRLRNGLMLCLVDLDSLLMILP